MWQAHGGQAHGYKPASLRGCWGRPGSLTTLASVPRVVEIISELRNLTVMEGEDATFKCVVSPEDVALTWQLGGQVVAPSERLAVSRNGLCHALTIQQCQPGDATTVTANAEGLVSAARLSVQGETSWRGCRGRPAARGRGCSAATRVHAGGRGCSRGLLPLVPWSVWGEASPGGCPWPGGSVVGAMAGGLGAGSPWAGTGTGSSTGCSCPRSGSLWSAGNRGLSRDTGAPDTWRWLSRGTGFLDMWCWALGVRGPLARSIQLFRVQGLLACGTGLSQGAGAPGTWHQALSRQRGP